MEETDTESREGVTAASDPFESLTGRSSVTGIESLRGTVSIREHFTIGVLPCASGRAFSVKCFVSSSIFAQMRDTSLGVYLEVEGDDADASSWTPDVDQGEELAGNAELDEKDEHDECEQPDEFAEGDAEDTPDELTDEEHGEAQQTPTVVLHYPELVELSRAVAYIVARQRDSLGQVVDFRDVTYRTECGKLSVGFVQDGEDQTPSIRVHSDDAFALVFPAHDGLSALATLLDQAVAKLTSLAAK